jgi:bifunctional non-homologous end joining protein LigD
MPARRAAATPVGGAQVRERLDPLIVKRSPLSEAVKKPKATWVKPEVDAEIEYGDITDDGLLREAVLKGVCDDLAAPAVHLQPLSKDASVRHACNRSAHRSNGSPAIPSNPPPDSALPRP